MNETITFITKDKKFEFTVKSEFLEKCPNPTEHSQYDLMTKFKANQFLHNPHGAAIHRLKDGFKDYWIDGNHATAEEAKKIEHGAQFKTSFLEETLE